MPAVQKRSQLVLPDQDNSNRQYRQQRWHMHRPVPFFALLILCMAIAPPSFAALMKQEPVQSQGTKPEPGVGEEVAAPLRVIENNAFSVGEHLKYVVRYGPIRAGYSSLSIPRIVNVSGHPSYLIESKAWANNFFKRLLRVDDKINSWTDTRGIFSWGFKKRLREGSFKQDIEAKYDQVNNLAFVGKDTMEVPPFVQDVLSAMYFVRTQKIVPGDTLLIDNHDNRKVSKLMVVVHKREKIKVKAGTFKCIVVEPLLKSPAVFKHNGRLVIHMTDDDRRIPVMMTSQIYVKAFNLGAVVAELEEMEGTLPR